MWNSLRPAAMRDDEGARHAVPAQTLRLDPRRRPGRADRRRRRGRRPRRGRRRARSGRRRLHGRQRGVRPGHAEGLRTSTVTTALGVEPVWEDGPAWTGQILAGRAAGWGWRPRVDLAQALAEIDAGLRS